MAVLLAVASALFIAVGIVVRQRSTIGVPNEHGVSGAMATALVRRPLWWRARGWRSVVTCCRRWLSRGSLLLVQPVLVSSLLFALPLSARLAHRRVTRSEWVWAVLLTVAIAVFVVMGNPRPGHARPPGLSWGLVAAVALPVVVGCVLGAARTLGRTPVFPIFSVAFVGDPAASLRNDPTRGTKYRGGACSRSCCTE